MHGLLVNRKSDRHERVKDVRINYKLISKFRAVNAPGRAREKMRHPVPLEFHFLIRDTYDLAPGLWQKILCP